MASCYCNNLVYIYFVVCLVSGDVTASEGTKYTNSIEMYTYANPHDDMDLYALPDTDDMDLYALPDKVQHYETVSSSVTHKELLVLHKL